MYLHFPRAVIHNESLEVDSLNWIKTSSKSYYSDYAIYIDYTIDCPMISI